MLPAALTCGQRCQSGDAMVGEGSIVKLQSFLPDLRLHAALHRAGSLGQAEGSTAGSLSRTGQPAAPAQPPLNTPRRAERAPSAAQTSRQEPGADTHTGLIGHGRGRAPAYPVACGAVPVPAVPYLRDEDEVAEGTVAAVQVVLRGEVLFLSNFGS